MRRPTTVTPGDWPFDVVIHNLVTLLAAKDYEQPERRTNGNMRTAALCLLGALVGAVPLVAQPRADGRRVYDRLCSPCHGADGQGGERAPGVLAQLSSLTDRQLAALVRAGLPGRGMPGSTVPDAEMRALVAFIRTLGADAHDPPARRLKVETVEGRTLEGRVLNETSADVQLATDDHRVHLLRREGMRYRVVTTQVDWPTYNGQPGGNRFSTIDQIDRTTVARLVPAWVFSIAGASRLEVTPVVVDGIMYVTAVNECLALDAGSGRQIWHFRRPRTKGVAGDAGGGINRGVAVAGDRVFMVTDHAHLLSIDRFTGRLLWDTSMADWRENYGATSAPLVVGDLVVSGTSGGDEGIRGFVAAFDQATGREVWRFWTVPRPGEPHSDTWRGTAIQHPCAATWLTGTYDPELNLLYWPTGNPCPDYDGRERAGDNLYSDSILALEAATGRLMWYFQFTPHDVWDWDAQQPPVLADVTWRGRRRALLLQANRNGFFYALDRTDGSLLMAEPFVTQLTWARAIGRDGRPVLVPNQEPRGTGIRVCPAVEGATNWFSTAFSPVTSLYYVQALESCSIYTRAPGSWQPGRSYYAGSTKKPPGEPGRKVLRALDVQTGAIRWELPQIGPGDTWGGVLATAGGLVFVAEDGGAFMAADAATGESLWRFQANVSWKASPMTYVFDGRQYVAIAAGPNILAFALPH